MNCVKITTISLFLVLALSFGVFADLPIDVQKGEFDGKYIAKENHGKYLILEEQAGNLDLVKTGYYEDKDLQKYSAVYQRRYLSPQTSVMAIKATNDDLTKELFYNEFVVDRSYVAIALKDFLVSPDSKRLFQSKENQIIYTRKETKLNLDGSDNTFAWISNNIIYIVNPENNKLNLDSAEVYLHLFLGLYQSNGVVEKPIEKELKAVEKNEESEEIEVERADEVEEKVEVKEVEEKKFSIINLGDNFRVNLQDGMHEFKYISYNYSSRVFVLLDKKTGKEFELVFAPGVGSCPIRAPEVLFEVGDDKLLIKGEEKCGENKVNIIGVDIFHTKQKAETNEIEKQKEDKVISLPNSPKTTPEVALSEKYKEKTAVSEDDSSTKLLMVAIKLEETKISLEIISKKLEGIANYYSSTGEERTAKIFSDASKEISDLTRLISSIKTELKDNAVDSEKKFSSMKEKVTQINLNLKNTVKKLLEAI